MDRGIGRGRKGWNWVFLYFERCEETMWLCELGQRMMYE